MEIEAKGKLIHKFNPGDNKVSVDELEALCREARVAGVDGNAKFTIYCDRKMYYDKKSRMHKFGNIPEEISIELPAMIDLYSPPPTPVEQSRGLSDNATALIMWGMLATVFIFMVVGAILFA